MEEWKQIGTTGYSVSNHGHVRNDRTGYHIKPSWNNYGHLKLSLSVRGQVRTYPVASLVAQYFVPGENDEFNTTVHLDGDMWNNEADNLVWRPRWFATKYRRQLGMYIEVRAPFENVETGERYNSLHECCVKNGFLKEDLLHAIVNGNLVFPTYQRFRFVEN